MLCWRLNIRKAFHVEDRSNELGPRDTVSSKARCGRRIQTQRRVRSEISGGTPRRTGAPIVPRPRLTYTSAAGTEATGADGDGATVTCEGEALQASWSSSAEAEPSGRLYRPAIYGVRNWAGLKRWSKISTRTWPPCVCPVSINSIPSSAARGNELGLCE